MKNRNICKFSGSGTERDLIAKRFIYETENPESGEERVLAYDKLLLTVTGSGRITVQGEARELSVGSLVFLFAGQTVFLETISDFSYMYIDFHGRRATHLYEKFGISAKSFVYDGMSSLIPVWREAIVNADGENIDLLCESMILYTFSKLSKNKSPSDNTVRAALDYINENFSSPTLNLTVMAKALGYNPKYLSHLISSELSVCFSDYLKDLRMKNAVMLIEEGVTSIKNLAVLSGYSNPLYFSKAFKQSFGISPKTFIENKKSSNTERNTK